MSVRVTISVLDCEPKRGLFSMVGLAILSIKSVVERLS